MNSRDQAFDIRQESAGEDLIQIGRHDVLHVINPGTLPVQPGLFRVVWANRKSDSAFLLRFPNRQEEREISTGRKRVKPQLHFPTKVSLLALNELAANRWVVRTRAFLPKRIRKENENLTEFEKAVKIRRKMIVSSFMSDKDLIRIFEYGQMGRYVFHAIEGHNALLTDEDQKLTRYHTYQVVYRFWLYGCIENGLISDSGNCGARGKYRNPGKAKRGRPSHRVTTGHAPDDVGVNTGPDDRALIWLAWENHGAKLGKYSATYNKMIENYFSDGWHENDEGDWVPTTHSLERRPSLETFRYYIKRKYTPIELLKQLIPNISWLQTKRALKGRDFDRLYGPAQTFMIDSTIADVYLVSVFNPYWIIGRPVVYLVRDVWSGMIVGVHVALEGPSWNTARLAIYNAFSPKGQFLRDFGFKMTDENWPCAEGCLDLVHDRGESLSISSTDSAHDLGIILSPCPSFRPDGKGSIETMFHWINNATVKWMPGAVLSRQRERGQRDNRLDATLTMYQFTRIIIHAILTFNKTADMHDRLVGPIAGLEIEPTPINLWRWGLQNLHGSPPRWDSETLYAALLPSAEVSIRPDGVRFAGRRYRGEISDKGQWQESARAFQANKIKVKYHPNKPHQILVLNEATGNFETLSMYAGDQIPEHARLEEIIDAKKYRELIHEGDEDVRLLDRIGHNRFRDEEIKKAEEARANAIPPASTAEHLSNIKDKRSFEAMVNRLFEASQGSLAGDGHGNDTAQSTSCDAPSDLLSKLLAETAKEMSND